MRFRKEKSSHVTLDEGPEDGHTFEISSVVRGSSGVLDGPKSDANWWSEPFVIQVRAWDLPQALIKAAQIPLH